MQRFLLWLEVEVVELRLVGVGVEVELYSSLHRQFQQHPIQ
jgi:hypothetical protein